MSIEILLVLGAYLMGSFPSALFVVRRRTGHDVREKGSGNVGASNTVRLAGWRAGILVTLADVAKGALPVWVMAVYNPSSRWLAAAMVAAVVGHCYPVWLRFRGGKGVATGFGAFVVIAPWAALWVFIAWVAILLISRMVSLASVLATACFPVVVYFVARPHAWLMVAASLVCAVIVIRHSSNIRNIAAGTEPRIGDEDGGGG